MRKVLYYECSPISSSGFRAIHITSQSHRGIAFGDDDFHFIVPGVGRLISAFNPENLSSKHDLPMICVRGVMLASDDVPMVLEEREFVSFVALVSAYNNYDFPELKESEE